MARGTRSQKPLADPGMEGAAGSPEPQNARRESAAVDDDGPEAATVASLEPALWKRLGDADSVADLTRAWLALQCQMIAGTVRGIVLLPGASANNYDAIAFWPEGSGRSPALAEAAELALRERRGVASGDSPELSDPTGMQHIAVPILLGGELQGAVAVTLRSGRAEDGRQALRQLQWGAAWIRERLRQARGAENDRLLERTGAALHLLGGALDHEGFEAAAMATVTGLAVRAKCSRVSLGFRDSKSVVVKVISHTAQFGKQMNLVSCLGAAMDEALDQRSVILYPTAADELLATSAHAELSRVQHDGQILTLPLLVGERFVGALTFERPPDLPFEPETVELLELVTSVVGPILEEKRQNDRWLVVKAAESLRQQLARLFGPGHLVRKLVATAMVLAVAFVTFAHSTYHVDADAKVEGLVRRAVVAPYDGFIKDATVRAGDTVKEGQVLATLEDRDLLLERLKWVTERQQHQFEYDKALASGEPAAINVIRSQIDQANAQIKLLDEELARIKLRSSISGLVVSGDLSQLIGASVQRGQVLFEVSPLDSYRVILSVDERDIGLVQPDQTGELVVSALPNETLAFKVDKITPIAETQSGRNVFRVEGLITGKSERLRPGMEGVGKIEIGRRSLAWIWLHPLIDWARIWSWHWLP
ncbi:MAG TPA: efflux RND transporter periplasmic adaptor subunit [Pirellulales bacterium]|nr:efflux RND transporter periplasmic adaptor subunit [Pirellulales bacterium]